MYLRFPSLHIRSVNRKYYYIIELCLVTEALAHDNVYFEDLA